jgi:wyosine [tRNA(Phe)-imidazoG37] synthetase (radical SAM superfamily)
MHRLTFQDHRRALDQNRYVYAVVSRRSKGLSIGVNLNPDKACNFACPYCQVDRNIPGGARKIDTEKLGEELGGLLGLCSSGDLWSVPPFDTAAEKYRRVNDIAFAGDGEPTACPDFTAAVSETVRQRELHGLHGVRLNLLTNATLFHRPRVREGLEVLWNAGGEVWAKLDAGTEEWFHRVDGTKLPFQRVLDNIAWAAAERPLVLQCMFHSFGGEGPSEAEAEAWAGRVGDIVGQGGSLRMVQVYTVARKPSVPSVQPLQESRLEEIAALARGAVAVHGVCVPVQVYP